MTEALKNIFQTELGTNSGTKRYRALVEIALAIKLPIEVVQKDSKPIRLATDETLRRLHALDTAGWKEAYGLYTNKLMVPTTRLSPIALEYIKDKISEYLKPST